MEGLFEVVMFKVVLPLLLILTLFGLGCLVWSLFKGGDNGDQA